MFRRRDCHTIFCLLFCVFFFLSCSFAFSTALGPVFSYMRCDINKKTVFFSRFLFCFYISTKFQRTENTQTTTTTKIAVEFKIMYYLRSCTLFVCRSVQQKHIINLNNLSKIKLRQHFVYIFFCFVFLFACMLAHVITLSCTMIVCVCV